MKVVSEAVDASDPSIEASWMYASLVQGILSSVTIRTGGAGSVYGLMAGTFVVIVNSDIGVDEFTADSTTPPDATALSAGGVLLLLNSVVRGGTSVVPDAVSVGIAYDEPLSYALIAGSVVAAGTVTGPSSRSVAVHTAGLKVFPTFVTVIDSVIDGGTAAQTSAFSLSVPWLLRVIHSDVWANNLDCYYEMEFDVGVPVCLSDPAQLNNPSVPLIQADGNISSDPLFNGDDFHLADNSPCIDAGVDPHTASGYLDYWYSEFGVDISNLISRDRDGDPRPYGAGWDIGPDEWTPNEKNNRQRTHSGNILGGSA
ncbi:MAG: hypothetical protein M5R36_18805 [Deltaproteobacteria bacterium]|nr:hypothetical protein [Deltaproteobacteria bacterium]